MSSDILRFTENPHDHESIEQYQYHEYQPITGANLNNSGENTINLESQNLFRHPTESFLIFEGRLTKADGTAYANADVITLFNNGILHLFNRIFYYMSNQEIETVSYPGQATTMLGMLKYPEFFSRPRVLISYGTKKQRLRQFQPIILGLQLHILISSPTLMGTFAFRIPLKHIFRFCEDCDKIVYGLKHNLSLVRKTDNDAIFRDAAADVGKVTLDKISWFVPQLIPADAEKFSIYKTTESKVKLPIAYRTRQCNMFQFLSQQVSLGE